jgi:hypothetical protein
MKIKLSVDLNSDDEIINFYRFYESNGLPRTGDIILFIFTSEDAFDFEVGERIVWQEMDGALVPTLYHDVDCNDEYMETLTRGLKANGWIKYKHPGAKDAGKRTRKTSVTSKRRQRR